MNIFKNYPMKTGSIKTNFHKLIDMIENESKLSQFYQALLYSAKKEGKLWNTLTKKEQEELMLAYEESNDEANLVSHEKVKAKYKKWLSK